MSWQVQPGNPYQQGPFWNWGLFLGFSIIAMLFGFIVADQDFGFTAYALAAFVSLILLQLAMRQPFFQTLIVYLSLAAFNYYYFYCSALTGRNPTDNWRAMGSAATAFEQSQKDILFIVVLGIAVVKLFKYRFEGRNLLAKKLNHPMVRLLSIWIIFSLIRAAFSFFEEQSLFNTILYLRTNVEYALIPFLFLTVLIQDERQLSQALKGLFYTLPIVSLLGIVEFFIHGSIYTKSFLGGEMMFRAASTLQNPNNLGAYIATTLGIYILFFLKQQLNRAEKWLFWPTLVLSLTCLFMTLSRSAMLFFFVAISIGIFLHLKSLKRDLGFQSKMSVQRITIVFMVGLLISFGVLIKYFNIIDAFQDASNFYLENTPVSRYRTIAVWMAIDYMIQHPSGLLQGYTKHIFYSLMDNSMAMMLIQNGLIGFTMYVMIFFGTLRLCYRRIFSNLSNSRKALYLSCLYLLVFQLLHGWTNFIQKNYPHNLYFWVFLGIIIWLESVPVKRSNKPDVLALTDSSPHLIQQARKQNSLMKAKRALPQ